MVYELYLEHESRSVMSNSFQPHRLFSSVQLSSVAQLCPTEWLNWIELTNTVLRKIPFKKIIYVGKTNIVFNYILCFFF